MNRTEQIAELEQQIAHLEAELGLLETELDELLAKDVEDIDKDVIAAIEEEYEKWRQDETWIHYWPPTIDE